MRKILNEKIKNNINEIQNETKTLISGRIVIYQKGNPSERQILAFNLNYAQVLIIIFFLYNKIFLFLILGIRI